MNFKNVASCTVVEPLMVFTTNFPSLDMIRLTWRALQKIQTPGMDLLFYSESEFPGGEPGNLLFKLQLAFRLLALI